MSYVYQIITTRELDCYLIRYVASASNGTARIEIVYEDAGVGNSMAAEVN